MLKEEWYEREIPCSKGGEDRHLFYFMGEDISRTDLVVREVQIRN